MKTNKAIIFCLLALSFFSLFFMIACDNPETIKIIEKPVTESRVISPGTVTYEDGFVRWNGNFSTNINGASKLRIAFEGYNSSPATNSTNRAVYIMGIDENYNVQREMVRVYASSNGSGGGDDNGIVTYNITEHSYRYIIGFSVFAGNEDGSWIENATINLTFTLDRNGVEWMKFGLVGSADSDRIGYGNHTRLAHRIFDGSLINSLLYNATTQYADGRFNVIQVKNTNNKMYISKVNCNLDGNLWFEYDYSPDGEIWYNAELGSQNLSINTSNHTLISTYGPVQAFRVTGFNTTSTNGNCTALFKFAGYQT